MALTTADVKFIDNYIAKHIDASNVKVVNLFSGDEADTNPLIACLCYFVLDLAYSEFSRENKRKWGLNPDTHCVREFDRARYLILKLDSDIYSRFID